MPAQSSGSRPSRLVILHFIGANPVTFVDGHCATNALFILRLSIFAANRRGLGKTPAPAARRDLPVREVRAPCFFAPEADLTADTI